MNNNKYIYQLTRQNEALKKRLADVTALSQDILTTLTIYYKCSADNDCQKCPQYCKNVMHDKIDDYTFYLECIKNDI